MSLLKHLLGARYRHQHYYDTRLVDMAFGIIRAILAGGGKG
jgi:hypothetical protein